MKQIYLGTVTDLAPTAPEPFDTLLLMGANLGLLGSPENAGRPNRDLARIRLSVLVNEWLVLGDVRPMMPLWISGPPRIELGQVTIGGFGRIGVQLLQAVTQSRALHVCSGCSDFCLRRGRRARTDQNNYCPTCKDGNVDVRDRKQAQRERELLARREDHGTA